MKKYSISSEWNNGYSVVGGYTDYETVAELIGAYLDRKNNKDSRITFVGLSSDYVNSLNYMEREKIVERDYFELLDVFEANGINDFRYNFGRLFFKNKNK